MDTSMGTTCDGNLDRHSKRCLLHIFPQKLSLVQIEKKTEMIIKITIHEYYNYCTQVMIMVL